MALDELRDGGVLCALVTASIASSVEELMSPQASVNRRRIEPEPTRDELYEYAATLDRHLRDDEAPLEQETANSLRDFVAEQLGVEPRCIDWQSRVADDWWATVPARHLTLEEVELDDGSRLSLSPHDPTDIDSEGVLVYCPANS